MPHISEIRQSRFLQQSDCKPPVLVTIRDCTQEDLAMEGQGPKMAWILHFDELEKGLVLKPINAEIISKITGNENTDNWVGHKIVLYSDPNVSMQGKLVGGIRARAPKNQAKPAAAATPAPVTEVAEDDVPF